MNSVIITAAGSGKRIGGEVKKQFIELKGKRLLEYTLERFINNDLIDFIVLVLPVDYIEDFKQGGTEKKIKKVEGGKERADSVRRGLVAAEKIFDEGDVAEKDRIVLIHDGVRPFVSDRLIRDVVNLTIEKGATVPVLPLTETVLSVDDDQAVLKYSDRESMRSVQTPQGYRMDIITKAYEKAGSDAKNATDESSMVFDSGEELFLLAGDRLNLKITTIEDLRLANCLIDWI